MRPCILWLTAALLAAVSPSVAPAVEPGEGGYLPLFAEILERYTRSVPETVGTTVDYPALLQKPVATQWARLLEQLADAPPPRTREERLAFWSNAYNILAIDTVLRAWPVDSIKDAGNLFFPVWRRDAGVAAGRDVTLHEIEHEILRPLMDPRIHGAIVCASISCPSLRRTPYGREAIDAQLDEQMQRFLTSQTKGLRIDRRAKRITLSKIFDWFDDDFDHQGGIPEALIRHAPEADRAWLAQHAEDADLEYFDYDWSLNVSPR